MLGPDQVGGPSQVAELEGADLVGWLNCECFFSLVLVGLLAALPFNLHCNGTSVRRHPYVVCSRSASEPLQPAASKCAPPLPCPLLQRSSRRGILT